MILFSITLTWGVSGAVIIAESHLTIHTWPEYGYAAADFFTCGDIDPWKSFELLETLLKQRKVSQNRDT